MLVARQSLLVLVNNINTTIQGNLVHVQVDNEHDDLDLAVDVVVDVAGDEDPGLSAVLRKNSYAAHPPIFNPHQFVAVAQLDVAFPPLLTLLLSSWVRLLQG